MSEPRTVTAQRVLMVVTWSLAEDTGYTVNARRTIDALRRDGHTVAVCQVVDRYRLESARRFADSRDADVVLMAPDAGVGAARAWALRSARRGVARAAERFGPDVVHARGLRAGSLCAELGGVPVLLDVRGDIVSEVRSAGADLAAPRGRSAVRHAEDDERKALRAAAGMVVVSDGMLDWITDRYPRVFGLPHAVVPCHADEPPAACPEPARDEGLSLVYAGGMQSYQPPAVVFEALSRVGALSDATRIDVYVTSQSEDVVRERDRLCPDARLETLPAAEVSVRLCSADIGLIPRTDDPSNAVACPTKIAEYLASGVPVAISPYLGRWPELLVSWGVGISLSASDDEIAAFAQQVRAHRAEVGQRCREVARAHFSEASAMRTLDGLYARLTGSAGPR